MFLQIRVFLLAYCFFFSTSAYCFRGHFKYTTWETVSFLVHTPLSDESGLGGWDLEFWLRWEFLVQTGFENGCDHGLEDMAPREAGKISTCAVATSKGRWRWWPNRFSKLLSTLEYPEGENLVTDTEQQAREHRMNNGRGWPGRFSVIVSLVDGRWAARMLFMGCVSPNHYGGILTPSDLIWR